MSAAIPKPLTVNRPDPESPSPVHLEAFRIPPTHRVNGQTQTSHEEVSLRDQICTGDFIKHHYELLHETLDPFILCESPILFVKRCVCVCVRVFAFVQLPAEPALCLLCMEPSSQ